MNYIAKYKREYYDKDGKPQSRWATLGVASQKESGGRIVLYVDALPPPNVTWDGSIILFPEEKKQ